MALTILEVLQDQTPKGTRAKNESLRDICALITKHMGEIEEARERGFSWKQIGEACRQSWTDGGKIGANFYWWSDNLVIESCYQAIKRNCAVKKKGKKKPLSLEVTVTER